MADEPREYLRAAQAAEVRGDRTEAAELLFKAAQLYRGTGKSSRALTILRHAQKLDPARKELAEEIKRLEWLPEQPLPRSTDDLEAEMQRVLEPLETIAEGEISIAGEPDTTLPGARRDLVERGPTLADPDAAAWCSFCCKPMEETGPLIAGPAGAFVCGGCVRESTRLLGGAGPGSVVGGAVSPGAPEAATLSAQSERIVASDVAPAPAQAQAQAPASAKLSELPGGTIAKVLQFARSDDDAVPPGTALEALTAAKQEAAVTRSPAAIEVASQLAARRELDQALEWGRRRILVLGPVGAGKSTVVRALAEAKRGFLFGPSSAPRSVPEDWLIALDDAQPTTEEGWARARSLWDRHGGVAVLTVRGRAPETSAVLLTEDARVAVPSTQAIVAATDGALPVEVAEKVDAVIVLDALEEVALIALATALLQLRGFAETFIAEAAPILAKAAQASGRGAHELLALIQRVPPGAWKFESAGPAKSAAKTSGTSKRRGRRKGEGP